MQTILILGYLLTIGSGLALIFKKRFEFTMVVSIFIDILILYICGLIFGDLRVGAWICVLLGFAYIGYFVFRIIRNRKLFWEDVKEYILQPGVLIFLIAYGFVFLVNRYRIFGEWDEFSHWGLVVKNMSLFNRFGNYTYSTVQFRGYPPATSLWEYFFVKLYRDYQECYAYRALGIFFASFSLPIIGRLSWRKFKTAVFYSVIVFIIPFIFNERYIASLYVDSMLGVLFGYLLYTTYIEKEYSFFHYLSVTSGICVLCLTKASGAMFAVIVSIAYITSRIKDTLSKNKNENRVEKKKFIYTLTSAALPCIIGLLIGKLSWSQYLMHTGTVEPLNSLNLSLSSLIKLISGSGDGLSYSIIYNFFDNIFSGELCKYILNMTYISWIIVCIIIFWLTFLLLKKINFQTITFILNYS